MVNFQMKSIQHEKDVLQGDKVHALGTLNSVLRQNTEYSQQLRLCSMGGTNASQPMSTDLSGSGMQGANTYVMASKLAEEDKAKAEELEEENKRLLDESDSKKLLEESDLAAVTKG